MHRSLNEVCSKCYQGWTAILWMFCHGSARTRRPLLQLCTSMLWYYTCTEWTPFNWFTIFNSLFQQTNEDATTVPIIVAIHASVMAQIWMLTFIHGWCTQIEGTFNPFSYKCTIMKFWVASACNNYGVDSICYTIAMLQYYICLGIVLTVILVLGLGLGFGIILYFVIGTWSNGLYSKGTVGALVGLLLQARGQDESALSTKTCLHQERRPLRTEYERFVQGCISFTSSWVDIRAA